MIVLISDRVVNTRRGRRSLVARVMLRSTFERSFAAVFGKIFCMYLYPRLATADVIVFRCIMDVLSFVKSLCLCVERKINTYSR